jgi:hypothetical protein
MGNKGEGTKGYPQGKYQRSGTGIMCGEKELPERGMADALSPRIPSMTEGKLTKREEI